MSFPVATRRHAWNLEINDRRSRINPLAIEAAFSRLLEILLDQALVVLHLNWLVMFVTYISHNHLRGSLGSLPNNLSERERAKIVVALFDGKAWLPFGVARNTDWVYVSLGGTILTLTPNIVKFAVTSPAFTVSQRTRVLDIRDVNTCRIMNSEHAGNQSSRILRQLPKSVKMHWRRRR